VPNVIIDCDTYLNGIETNDVMIERRTQKYWKKVTSPYSETFIHRFRRGSEKETMDPGKQ
jgi:hypothetical protein